LRFGHSLPKDHPTDKSIQYFAKLVSEKSKGDLVVKIYPAGQLGQQRELIEQMQNGAIDFVHANASPLASFAPEFGIFDLPYLIRDADHFDKVVDSPVGKEILESSRAKGFVGLAYYDGGSRSFYAKKPVPTPSDLKGLKVRVQPGPVSTRMANLLGAIATPLAWGEVYTALQTGVVDAAENNVTALTLARHGEVMKFYTRDEHTRTPDIILVATATLDRLTPEQKKIVASAARESATWHAANWRKALQDAEKDAVKMGVTFVEADKAAYRKAVQPMYDELSPELADLAKRIQAVK